MAHRDQNPGEQPLQPFSGHAHPAPGPTPARARARPRARCLTRGAAALAFGAAMLLSPAAQAGPADTARAAAWFDAHKARVPLLRQFVQRMPKGAELHSHLSGAVYAESWLAWAAADGQCVDTESLAFAATCPLGEDGKLVPVKRLVEPALIGRYNALVDRMSTRNLAHAGRSGHDQFFDAFATFPSMPNALQRQAEMAAEVLDRAARQQVLHAELMITFQGSAVRTLGGQLPWADETDFARRLAWLKAQPQGLEALVGAARANLDTLHAALGQQLGCTGAAPQPGCGVSLRWLQQITRTAAPEVVFAQFAHAFALAAADPRVVGINLVAPEDHPIALRDYTLQMQMVGFLSRQYPGVKIALHAGELALGLVAPQHLRSHIREAVTVAGAHRLGHAVDIGHEDDAPAILAAMKARRVAAEICLTSNDVILGVKGRDHPLPVYLAAGVPVVLASDDEGISRIDLSNEYLRAATEHGLGYRALKQLSRNSLEYSFLPGDSLWADAASARPAAACRRDVPGSEKPSAACRALLDSSERAARQWALEQAFDRFERQPDWRAHLATPRR